jgi:hypothetical protein
MSLRGIALMPEVLGPDLADHDGGGVREVFTGLAGRRGGASFTLLELLSHRD